MTNFTGPVKFKSEASTKSKVKKSSKNCIPFYLEVNSKVIKPNAVSNREDMKVLERTNKRNTA